MACFFAFLPLEVVEITDADSSLCLVGVAAPLDGASLSCCCTFAVVKLATKEPKAASRDVGGSPTVEDNEVDGTAGATFAFVPCAQ